MCKLQLHPQKTKIVYCKDSNRCDISGERLNDGSRMSREVHVRFWESVEVRFLCATRLYHGIDQRRPDREKTQARVVALFRVGLRLSRELDRQVEPTTDRVDRILELVKNQNAY
ncbi:MAG: hypothetical protein ACREXR_05960 [Gammaproteobacteria bacterium]